MARRVFFSFHYDDVDTFRANVVRQHGITKDTEVAGFFDASLWEEAQRRGSESIKRLINSGLENTSVTCALIGTDTWSREWVRYEILKSYDRGNPLFGVNINGIKDKYQQTFPQGANPFEYVGFVVSADGQTLTYYEKDNGQWKEYAKLPPKNPNFAREFWGKGYALSQWVPCYDWSAGNGYHNFPTWLGSAK